MLRYYNPKYATQFIKIQMQITKRSEVEFGMLYTARDLKYQKQNTRKLFMTPGTLQEAKTARTVKTHRDDLSERQMRVGSILEEAKLESILRTF